MLHSDAFFCLPIALPIALKHQKKEKTKERKDKRKKRQHKEKTKEKEGSRVYKGRITINVLPKECILHVLPMCRSP